MTEIESWLKEENRFIKELFNFNGTEAQLTHIKVMIEYSEKDPSYYFFKLLNFYSKCRPHHQGVSKELVDCICSCFPEQILEIKRKIIEYRITLDILKFIMFPEEFSIEVTKEQK